MSSCGPCRAERTVRHATYESTREALKPAWSGNRVLHRTIYKYLYEFLAGASSSNVMQRFHPTAGVHGHGWISSHLTRSWNAQTNVIRGVAATVLVVALPSTVINTDERITLIAIIVGKCSGRPVAARGESVLLKITRRGDTRNHGRHGNADVIAVVEAHACGRIKNTPTLSVLLLLTKSCLEPPSPSPASITGDHT